MKDFREKVQAKFDEMSSTGKLFRANITGQQVWDLYLNSFTEEQNPVFRDPESSTHNCNHCKNFIRRYGNIVAINDEFDIITMFDVEAEEEYAHAATTIANAIKSVGIRDIFFETFNELNSLPYETCKKTNSQFQLGVQNNHKKYTKAEAEMYGVVQENEIRTFEHLSLKVNKNFVDMSGKSIEAIMAEHRDNKNVFQRAMVEIPLDTLSLVRDLILQGSLLNGDTHLHKIEAMIPLKTEFDSMPNNQQLDNWCWIKSHKFQFAKFKNELIGVLCSELAEGEELNKACQSWNKRVDPANYMKAVAPITETQKKNAQAFVEENGYVESFNRRHATLEDIKADEIKHINVGDGTVKAVSMFDDVKTTSSRHKRNEFKGVEEVPIDKFMTDILPGCTSVEAFIENRHEGNLVSMTTSNDENCKPMFKWSNPFSWTYKGNLAGKSMIKESVKSQGGKVDGVLRFSIMWSEGDSKDDSDLDAHCIEPNRNEIYYSSKLSRKTGGNLDIDIMTPSSHKRGGENVVENITYPSLERMDDGVYKLFVRQFSARNSQGFTAEIEFDGEIHEYTYNQPVRGDVQVAEVTLKDGQFSIKHKLDSTSSSKSIYGLDTQQFHKVNLVCLSPNHWRENNVGNKHYFFMLDNCKCDTSIRSFHSENLDPELAQHRKVLEILGAVNAIEPSDNQLSGVGFNATVKDDLILRLKGNFKRVIKVKF